MHFRLTQRLTRSSIAPSVYCIILHCTNLPQVTSPSHGRIRFRYGGQKAVARLVNLATRTIFVLASPVTSPMVHLRCHELYAYGQIVERLWHTSALRNGDLGSNFGRIRRAGDELNRSEQCPRDPPVRLLSPTSQIGLSMRPLRHTSSLSDAIPQPASLLKRWLDAYTSACALRLSADVERDGKRSDAPSGAGET